MRSNKITIFAMASLLTFTTACDDYLDKLPDNRATVDTEKDVTDLLTDCYPSRTANLIMEMASDNVRDNGNLYNGTLSQEQAYKWEQVTGTSNDDVVSIWGNFYGTVASCNEVLQDIDIIGRQNLMPQRAEALICRAYSMFELARTFCMAYNPETAANELGLPYPTEPEKDINTVYVRGNLEDLYAKINADIEEALPNIDENHLSDKATKYHFNRQAAYAFAARFNLYYQKFDKTVEYANQVFGADPTALLRDYEALANLSAYADYKNTFLDSSEPANFLIQINTSIAGRALNAGSSSYRRYNHGYQVQTNELYWAPYMWQTSSSASVYNLLFGSREYSQYFPKMAEFFEVTDKVNNTGYAHTILAMFTGEQLLLERAEALALLGRHDEALADANLWLLQHLRTTTTAKRYYRTVPLTISAINEYYNGLPYAEASSDGIVSLKKELHPQGFASLIADETTENLIQVILQMRRLETLDYGVRFSDIKRYGISFAHNIEKSNDIVFLPGDKRGAIQLPEDVIQAGLEANPR